MKLPTLEEFIGEKWSSVPTNAYVTSPKFKELYVRRSSRILGGQWVEGVLDLARIEAKRPGNGAFSSLVADLLKRGIPIYVECVQNPRFAQKLESMGFTCASSGEACPSFFKLA